MTAYEKELLALAYEHIGSYREITVRKPGDVGGASAHVWGPEKRLGIGLGPTLADALTALLRDLGVEVPERPSVNTKTASGVSIRALEGLFTYGQWAGSLVHLRSLYAREPLIVLALLEGGES